MNKIINGKVGDNTNQREMVTVELIKQLIIPNNEIKWQIEQKLNEAYIGIQNLRKMSFDKTLTLEYLEEIENLFLKNEFDAKQLHLPKYLQKYAERLSEFWVSYSLFNKTFRISNYNLFISYKECLLKGEYYSFESETSFILRKMEDYWMASNQVYTKYEISLIRKEYLR